MKRFIKKSGMTVSEVAKALKLHRTTVVKWITDGNIPRYDTLVKLSKLINIPVEDIIKAQMRTKKRKEAQA
jgi:excisionase family DNA binding protein